MLRLSSSYLRDVFSSDFELNLLDLDWICAWKHLFEMNIIVISIDFIETTPSYFTIVMLFPTSSNKFLAICNFFHRLSVLRERNVVLQFCRVLWDLWIICARIEYIYTRFDPFVITEFLALNRWTKHHNNKLDAGHSLKLR